MIETFCAWWGGEGSGWPGWPVGVKGWAGGTYLRQVASLSIPFPSTPARPVQPPMGSPLTLPHTHVNFICMHARYGALTDCDKRTGADGTDPTPTNISMASPG